MMIRAWNWKQVSIVLTVMDFTVRKGYIVSTCYDRAFENCTIFPFYP
jgi:hypothetical protein